MADKKTIKQLRSSVKRWRWIFLVTLLIYGIASLLFIIFKDEEWSWYIITPTTLVFGWAYVKAAMLEGKLLDALADILDEGD